MKYNMLDDLDLRCPSRLCRPVHVIITLVQWCDVLLAIIFVSSVGLSVIRHNALQLVARCRFSFIFWRKRAPR